MSEHRKIPLFPLKTVLFPGMMLPLHIFEERYRRMIYRCVTEETGFGVVLIRSGPEVGPGATVFEIGTIAKIARIEPFGDGRMALIAAGQERFKIAELSEEEPYLTGLVEPFPLLVEADKLTLVSQETARVETLFRSYLKVIANAGKVDLGAIDLPDNSTALANQVAITLDIPNEDKQQLLSQASLADLLVEERLILERELGFLQIIAEHSPGWTHSQQPFSPN